MHASFKKVMTATLLTVLGLSASAQTELYDRYYPNEDALMTAFGQQAAAFIEEGNYLTVEEAERQLKEVEGKVVTIKRVPERVTDLSASEVYGKLLESVAILGVSYDCGRCDRIHINPTTGYVLDEDGICVTNYHVIMAYLQGKGQYLSMQIRLASGEAYPVVELLAASRSSDLVIFRVDTKGAKLTPIPLGPEVEISTPVYTLSHPSNMLFVFSSGMVSRKHQVRLGTNPLTYTPEVDVTLDYAVGSSGAPIVDRRGNLVSTVSKTRTIFSGGETSVPQMVVHSTKPTLLLREMIRFE